MLRGLWPYFRRYRREYLSGLGLVVAGVGLAVTIPLIIKKAMDVLEQGDTAGAMGIFAAALVGFGIARSLVVFRGRFAIIAASRRIEADLRDKIYRKLMKLPPRWFDKTASGDIESRVINDVEGVRMVVGIGVMMIASSGILMAASLASMATLNAKLALAAAIPLALVTGVTAWLTPRIYDLSEEVQDRLGEVSNAAQENFTAARVVRAFALEDIEQEKFAKASAAYRDANLRLAWTRGIAWGAMALLIEATLAVMLFVGGQGLADGTLSKGEFTAFVAYLFGMGWPVIAMGWILTIYQRGAACWERISKILAEPEDADGRLSSEPSAGKIELKDLTFRYTPERPAALDGVSLSIAPGERVAIVGRTGSGKSTLIQLLLGLYPVARGKLFIDGKDVNDYSKAALRAAMGAVPQDVFLFSDSIEANIAFGARESVGREAVMRAAADARLTDDLSSFPDGIAQVIGERGITLSGGQKQRTAIARALIRKPSILLFDDALSSVDVGTERAILDRLDAFLKGRTCVIVTHRFSIVSRVDRVLVFDEGKLVEQGKHEELLNNNGFYARLVARQRAAESLDQS